MKMHQVLEIVLIYALTKPVQQGVPANAGKLSDVVPVASLTRFVPGPLPVLARSLTLGCARGLTLGASDLQYYIKNVAPNILVSRERVRTNRTNPKRLHHVTVHRGW